MVENNQFSLVPVCLKLSIELMIPLDRWLSLNCTPLLAADSDREPFDGSKIRLADAPFEQR